MERKGIIMKRKILIPVIIVVLVAFVAIGIFGCQRKPISVSMEEGLPTQTETETPTETPKEIQIEELRKDCSLFISEITQVDCSVSGIVKEISNRNLTVVGFTETEEKTSSLIVPVSQDAKIIANYILYSFPKGTSEGEIEEYIRGQSPEKETGEEIEEYNIEIPEGIPEEEIDEYIEEYLKKQTSEKKTGEEITGKMSGPNGEICYLGEKEISFEKITIGDVVFIVLDSKSATMEGTYVEVWAVDFFDDL